MAGPLRDKNLLLGSGSNSHGSEPVDPFNLFQKGAPLIGACLSGSVGVRGMFALTTEWRALHQLTAYAKLIREIGVQHLNNSPGLIGFLFEAQQAGTFNVNAQLANQQLYARLTSSVRLPGHPADVWIFNNLGEMVHQAQMKASSQAMYATRYAKSAFKDPKHQGMQIVVAGLDKSVDGVRHQMKFGGVFSEPVTIKELQVIEGRLRAGKRVRWPPALTRKIVIRLTGKGLFVAGASLSAWKHHQAWQQGELLENVAFEFVCDITGVNLIRDATLRFK